MNPIRITTLVLLLFTCLSSSLASAKNFPHGPRSPMRMGALLGLGTPTGDTYGGSRLALGVDFYVESDPRFDWGGSYLTGSSVRWRNGRLRRSNFWGGELDYKLPQVGNHFYVGASAGFSSFDIDGLFWFGVDDIYFGPKVGTYTFIAPDLSLGGEAKIILVGSDPVLGWLQLLGAFRFHF